MGPVFVFRGLLWHSLHFERVETGDLSVALASLCINAPFFESPNTIQSRDIQMSPDTLRIVPGKFLAFAGPNAPRKKGLKGFFQWQHSTQVLIELQPLSIINSSPLLGPTTAKLIRRDTRLCSQVCVAHGRTHPDFYGVQVLTPCARSEYNVIREAPLAAPLKPPEFYKKPF